MKASSTRRRSLTSVPFRQKAKRTGYAVWSGEIAALLVEARRQSARSVNAILTATYWEIGRRIVEFEQHGKSRADYGDALLKKLSTDLSPRFGRGFGWRNLFQMRAFYLVYAEKLQTVSAISQGQTQIGKLQTLSGISPRALMQQILSAESGNSRTSSCGSFPDLALYLEALGHAFPLSWSHYGRLLSVERPEARKFYEEESLRGGWSVRQLDRQIGALFYERTALSKDKARLLTEGSKARPDDAVSVEEEIKNPYVLEFLDLRDDYAENDLEEALVRHLEAFLLELGNGFTFVARQKRIRVGKEWYRIDLVLFHRRLRCLIIIDLKIGRLTHADAGQMNLYVNYAAEHLAMPGENPPVGLVLCSEHDEAVAHYSMGNLRNKILAAEYKLNLPDTRLLEKEIAKTRRLLESPVRRKP